MDSAIKNEDQPMTEDEVSQIVQTKLQLSHIYESLIFEPDQSLEPFLEILHQDIIRNDTAPTSVLRLAIRTLIKIFEKASTKNIAEFNPHNLVVSLMNCQIDDHSNKIDAQELIWINI